MPNIHVASSDGRTYNFPVKKDNVSIGRGKDNDIVLNDNTVSRNHAQIVKSNEGYVITDLGSFNSTQVNGESIQTVLLKQDDRIEIGLTKLIFSETGQAKASATDSLILDQEDDQGKIKQQIVQRSPQSPSRDSNELLISTDSHRIQEESSSATPSEESIHQSKSSSDLSSLERSNKVLFVLYEISRQLHSIHDFNELLNKIMDLVFKIIDADSGFLVLTGEEGVDDLIPVVVKYKDDTVKGKEQLKASRTIIKKVIQDKVALLTSDAMDDSRLDCAKSVLIQQIRSAMCVPLWKKDKIIGVIQLDSIRLDNQFTNDDLELLKAIGSQMAMVIEQASLNEQIREEEMIRSRLERFHSPQVIEMILKGGQETIDNIMDPKDLTATILFTDIIGFTRISEQMPPREINVILNQYFSRMTDVIFKYDGTLDKYIGDGLMAVFGAPMEKQDDAERAIQAALEMRQELTAMQEELGEKIKISARPGGWNTRLSATLLTWPHVWKPLPNPIKSSSVKRPAGLFKTSSRLRQLEQKKLKEKPKRLWSIKLQINFGYSKVKYNIIL